VDVEESREGGYEVSAGMAIDSARFRSLLWHEEGVVDAEESVDPGIDPEAGVRADVGDEDADGSETVFEDVEAEVPTERIARRDNGGVAGIVEVLVVSKAAEVSAQSTRYGEVCPECRTVTSHWQRSRPSLRQLPPQPFSISTSIFCAIRTRC
jgi:hypothetical protein